MSEPILKALIKLFVLISDVRSISEISNREKDIVKLFLQRQLSSELVKKYMEMFDEFLVEYYSKQIDRGSIRDRKRTSLISIRILGICEKINDELDLKQKFYVLVQLFDFIFFGAEITENENEFIETVSVALNISDTEFKNIRDFILKNVSDVPEKNKVLIIDDKDTIETKGVKHLYKKNLKDSLYLLYISCSGCRRKPILQELYKTCL